MLGELMNVHLEHQRPRADKAAKDEDLADAYNQLSNAKATTSGAAVKL